MNSSRLFCFFAAVWTTALFHPLPAAAQAWSQILSPNQAIDWSSTGVGAIPARDVSCANLSPSATVVEINAALASCPAGRTVNLAPGSYTIAGTIAVPSQVTLRGAGADRTILNAMGSDGGYAIALGSGSVSYHPLEITGGSGSGSTTIQVSEVSNLAAGQYLVITEQNDSRFVSAAGSEGNCNWCDGWTSNGAMARGQIVSIQSVSGNAVTISPGLYGSYTNSPVAVPFNMSAIQAGVEDLQVKAQNKGYAANFGMATCAFCWLKGVESNYTDGDHVEVSWGFHDEIRDSYFSNAFLHVPGRYDSDIQLAFKTSATLVENNIIERGHVSVMLEWGAAGNVVAYNYMMGEFDSSSVNLVIGGINFHGAHPQFNLLEGNVVTQIYADSIWGSSSQITAFRNWVVGTNRVCNPVNGRATVNCSGNEGHYAFQAARAMQVSYLSTLDNFIGNVVGSEQMQSLKAYGRPEAQIPALEYPATRPYDTTVLGWSFGYGDLDDSGPTTNCRSTPPCHLPGTAATDFLHGNFNNVDGSVHWVSGVTNALPASFYLPSRPKWWFSVPFPAIGPDVTGGSGPAGHSYGNPAQACYLHALGGTDGGAGSPLNFNAEACYPSQSHRKGSSIPPAGRP